MYKDIPTNSTGVRVHITGYAGDERTGCTLRGYAIDGRGIRIDGSKTLRRTAGTAADIPTAEQHLVAAVVNALPIKPTASHVSPHRKKLDQNHPMVQAFEALCNGNFKVSVSWNAAVEKRYLSGFGNRMLPQILKFISEPFTDIDREILLKNIADDVRQHGNSKKNDITVLTTARKELTAYDTVYNQGLRRIDPMLPALQLAPYRRAKGIAEEQIKSLPQAIRREFAKKLKNLIPEEPLLVFGAAVMWDAGLRTAEASAVIPEKDFDSIGSVVSINVCWQEKSGKRSPILKTDAAYRKVPLSAWGQAMVTMCCEHINSWPIDSTDAPITSDALQRFIKKLLRECNLGDNYWAVVQSTEAKNPDRDSEGNPKFDVVAYTLRHDRASIWRNICGLTVEECDFLLGHANRRAKKRKVDYRLNGEQVKLGRKLENFVCDIEISKHPGLVPVALKHGDNHDIFPYVTSVWTNASDLPLCIDIDIIAEEAAEEIAIEFDAGSVISLVPRAKSTYGERHGKPIIGTGQLPDEEEKHAKICKYMG